jgi:hypothetical protein
VRHDFESRMLFAVLKYCKCVIVTGQQLCGREGVDRYPDKDLSDKCEQAETLPSISIHQRALALVSTVFTEAV